MVTKCHQINIHTHTHTCIFLKKHGKQHATPTTCKCWYEFELGITSWEDFAGPGLGSATFDGGIGEKSCTWARTGGGEGCLIPTNWKGSSLASLINAGDTSSTGRDHLPSSKESTDSIVEAMLPESLSFTPSTLYCAAWSRLSYHTRHEIENVTCKHHLTKRNYTRIKDSQLLEFHCHT